MTIVVEDAAGMPLGSYDVRYYRMRDGEVVNAADSDHAVPEAYVRRVAGDLDADEAIVAMHVTQPGGLTAYGSDATRLACERAWNTSP